jgi:hypothetical protein
MPTPDSSDARRALARLLSASAVVVAVWLGISSVLAQQDGQRVPRTASAALEHAARYMMSVPGKADGVALAAQGTQEGHWRFVNRAGEMFTVGTPDEMKRVVAVLYPEAKAGARIVLYMTEDTVFRHRAALKVLPASAELNMVVVGGESYRLQRRSEGERLLAEVRPDVGVELREEGLFVESLWQLARPLGRARVRVLALEPGGPRTLAARPRIDPAGKHPLVDMIDPTSLASGMGSVAGQVLLVVGRVDRDVLYVRPSSGAELGIPLGDLVKAAAAADVNLMVLQTAATPRQPSGRNRLWDPERALQRAQLSDLLGGIAGRSRQAAVVATAAGGRTALDVTLGDLPGSLPARAVRDRLAAIVADLSGRAAMTGVQASLLAAERQRELDQRIISGIAAVVQVGYVALLALGLLGMPVARAWWARVWPPETEAEYAGRSGYWAACAVRGLVFLAVFLPMAAVVAGPYNLVRLIGRAVRGKEDRGAAPAAKPRRRARA